MDIPQSSHLLVVVEGMVGLRDVLHAVMQRCGTMPETSGAEGRAVEVGTGIGRRDRLRTLVDVCAVPERLLGAAAAPLREEGLVLVEVLHELDERDRSPQRPDGGEHGAGDQGLDEPHAQPVEPEELDEAVELLQLAPEEPLLGRAGRLGDAPGDVVLVGGPDAGRDDLLVLLDEAVLVQRAVHPDVRCDPPEPEDRTEDQPQDADDRSGADRERTPQEPGHRGEDHEAERDREPEQEDLLLTSLAPVDGELLVLRESLVVLVDVLLAPAVVEALGPLGSVAPASNTEDDRHEDEPSTGGDAETAVDQVTEHRTRDSGQESPRFLQKVRHYACSLLLMR